MTTLELKVKELINTAYKKTPAQIVIDLSQEIEEAIDTADIDEPLTAETVGAFAYQTDIIIDIIDSVNFNWEFQYLTVLYKTLNELEDEIRNRNLLLGIPVNKG